MLVPELLLETLEDLVEKEFQRFKWYLALNVLNDRTEISRCYLESSERHVIVGLMTQTYGEEVAVKMTAEVLRRMKHNSAAKKLEQTYTEGAAAKEPVCGPLVTSPPAFDLPPAQKSFTDGANGVISQSLQAANNVSMVISGTVGSVVNNVSCTTALTVHHHHYFHT